MSIETEDDVRGLRRAGAAVAATLRAVRAAVRPGVTTRELDAVAVRTMRRHGARSAPELTYRYPGAICVSVDDEIVHGIPGRRRLRRGELVTLDVALEVDGFFADAAITVPVGAVSADRTRLTRAARAALRAGIGAAVAGRPVADIGAAVAAESARWDAAPFPELCGHGIGRALHEDPSVPNVPTREGERTVLTEGLVLTVEPMLGLAGGRVVQDGDGWTLRTPDGTPSAHFEHTIVVTDGAPLVLTA